MDTSGDLKLNVTPMEYFHAEVGGAQSRLNIHLPEHVEFYVVNLLYEFIHPEVLNGTVGSASVIEQPLVLLYKEALELPSNQQLKAFKRLGDVSLYIAGFFQDYFNRRTYDVDYYMGMGRSAYNAVSQMMRERHNDQDFEAFYLALVKEFPKMVEVLAEVSDTRMESHPDPTTLYARWLKNPTGRLRRKLERLGILSSKAA